MGVFDWILGILLLIICLGVLVTIHEFGHFFTAKLFNVYCLEFSIGFGPAIYTRKPDEKRGQETKFSIRAIPFGGYVSMFGEESDEESSGPIMLDVPKERSLENIAKWKRAIVYVAGVCMNFILGFILIIVSTTAFNTFRPVYGFYDSADGSLNAMSFSALKVSDDSQLSGKISYDDKLIAGYYYVENVAEFVIIDDEIEIPGVTDAKFVLCANPLYTSKFDPIFTDAISIYPQSDETLTLYNGENVLKIVHLPDYSNGAREIIASDTINFDISFEGKDDVNVSLTPTQLKDSYGFENIGLSFELRKIERSFGSKFKEGCSKFGQANTAIFRALGQLFTKDGMKNVGGVVMMGKTISEVNYNFGFGMYLFYAGFISCNLAIFNLLPFPGLDGWSLLVVAIEGITRKKVPQNIKSIVSFIGLILLFGLMIVITVKDILSLLVIL